MVAFEIIATSTVIGSSALFAIILVVCCVRNRDERPRENSSYRDSACYQCCCDVCECCVEIGFLVGNVVKCNCKCGGGDGDGCCDCDVDDS